MDIEKEENIIKTLKEAVVITADTLGTIASPATMLLMTLYNSTGKGRGFDGYAVNQGYVQTMTQPTQYKDYTFYPFSLKGALGGTGKHGGDVGAPNSWTEGFAILDPSSNWVAWNTSTVFECQSWVDYYLATH
jgi:hypothetical protein